jgi:DnaK suppressor protein
MGEERDETLDVDEAVRAERERIALQIADLTEELGAIVESAAATVPDDEHDAEGSTVGFERARVSALLDGAVRHLAELDAVVARSSPGERRRCADCGRPIADERVAALPATRLCADCAMRRASRA